MDTAVGRPAGVDLSLHGRQLRLIRGDLTALDVEAFVFYARPSLDLGSGFGSAIARRGGPAIKQALEAIGSIAVTQAVVTPGGRLKAAHIVHAAGPAFQEPDLDTKLRATVLNALGAAEAHGIRQLALPAMGAGFSGVPLPDCVRVMVDAMTTYLAGGPALRELIICANDGREYRAFEAALAAVGAAAAMEPAHE